MNENDRANLKSAKLILENPSMAAKITNLFGIPIEKGLELLPRGIEGKIGTITNLALEKAADAALFTMQDVSGDIPSNVAHKIAVSTSGAVGGFFGIAGLAFELPISTTIMLRSIADIARSQGADLKDPLSKMQCIAVFGLGSKKSESDDATETGYMLARAALARTVSEAAEFYAGKEVASRGAPALVHLISVIASRFSVQVSEKVAAQAIPVIGAAGGAAINALFMDHFQEMAKAHFTVLRLEAVYGADVVNRIYGEC